MPSVKPLPGELPLRLRIPPWLELSLCWLLLTLKIVHFWRSRGILSGYDIGDHLQRYAQTDWWMPQPGLHESFYAYHPPLAFLLPHLLARLGMDGVIAIQLFGTLCGTAAFLLFRGILKHLGLLENGVAVGFLYLWSAMPILVNCDVSLNLDVAILGWSCLVLFCSVRLWKTDLASRWSQIGWAGAIVLALVGAMLTKFSGLLLFALPPLVFIALRFGQLRKSRAALAGALILPVTAALLVFPYYQQRYLETENTLFPRNQDWWIPEQIQEARAIRDGDRLAWFMQLLLPRFLQPPRPIETRASDVQRYSDVWRDFWIRDDSLYYQPEKKLLHGALAVRCGVFYDYLLTIFCLAGLVVWLKIRGREPLDRLGWVLLAESAIFIAAHLVYCYQDATPSYHVTKGIYILPATAGVAFLAVQWLRAMNSDSRIATYGGAVLLACWMGLNYLLPVY